jgi:hypothetical protein
MSNLSRPSNFFQRITRNQKTMEALVQKKLSCVTSIRNVELTERSGEVSMTRYTSISLLSDLSSSRRRRDDWRHSMPLRANSLSRLQKPGDLSSRKLRFWPKRRGKRHSTISVLCRKFSTIPRLIWKRKPNGGRLPQSDHRGS